MPGPFRIYIDGRELQGWTSATLSRQKADLTGSLSVDIFFNYVPTAPVAVEAVRGREVTVYVANQLAFTGILDRRGGKSVKGKQATTAESTSMNGGGIERSIGPNGYQVTLTARGKTKYLIDSSHQHPTTNILRTNNREVIQKLTEYWNIELDWTATQVELPVVRLRDGGRVLDELRRIGNETCVFIYETRDGKLRVTDGAAATVGDALVLGQNILSFSATQSEDQANSEITVKGQRSEAKYWGEDAVIDRMKKIQDGWVQAKIPLTIQHYGDASDEGLERRGKFEADKRATESKTVTVEVFHVQSQSGAPWDIGNLHYVEVPPEGIFDVMECTELTYRVSADGELTTTLTLTPPPSSGVVGGANGPGGLLTNAIPGLADALARGVARRQQLGVSIIAGQYPAGWGSADLVSLALTVANATQVGNALLQDDIKRTPPLELPESMQ